jgi:hypothetical protein
MILKRNKGVVMIKNGLGHCVPKVGRTNKILQKELI